MPLLGLAMAMFVTIAFWTGVVWAVVTVVRAVTE